MRRWPKTKSTKLAWRPKWRRFLLVTSLVLLSGSAFYYQASDQLPQPRPETRLAPLVYEPPLLDLGAVPDNQTVEFVVPFVWKGQGYAEILGTRSDCGCTDALVEPDLLQTGQRGQLSLIFDPAGMRGPVERSVTIRLDQGDAIFRFQAQVLAGIRCQPELLHFGEPRRGDKVERELSVHFLGPARRLILLDPPPGIQLTSQTLSENRNRIRLTLDSSQAEPFLDGHLLLATEDDTKVSTTVAVFGEIR